MAEYGLYVVADGMGGHASGEIASKMAVDTLHEFFAATADDPERTWPYKMDRAKGYEENRLITGIKLCNLRIYEQAQRNSKQRGMGTTICTLFAVEDGVYIAHVGDSRVYRIRNGFLQLITEDHSLLNDWRRMKPMSGDEIRNFPHRNVVVRALGLGEHVAVDVYVEEYQIGDIYLMCSDGLNDMLEDHDILSIVESKKKRLDGACSALVDAANEAGGKDNITVLLAQVLEA